MNVSHKKVMALFQPQEWTGRNQDYAMSIGEPIEIDVTYPLVNLSLETIQNLKDNSTEADWLVEGLHDHGGPFCVTVQETAQVYFGVEDLHEVTREMLDEVKASVIKPPMTNHQFLAHGGDNCPFCESNNLDVLKMEADGNIAWQHVTCNACGETWTDRYKLIGYDRAPDIVTSANTPAPTTPSKTMVSVDLNIVDNEGNVVDGTTSELSHDQISDIIDHAAQLVLMARDDKGDWGGLISKPRDCSQILTELEDALITANVISESKHALAEVIVTLFSEDGKCIILGFTKKGEKILDQRETLAGESEDHTRKAVFTNKDVQVSVNGEKWRDIEKCGRLEEIVEAMLSNATYATIYALAHNSEPTCTCDHTQPGSVCRRYDDKDDNEPVYSFGRYNKLGDFCPDKSVDLSGGRYDLADDSDTCLICAGQI